MKSIASAMDEVRRQVIIYHPPRRPNYHHYDHQKSWYNDYSSNDAPKRENDSHLKRCPPPSPPLYRQIDSSNPVFRCSTSTGPMLRQGISFLTMGVLDLVAASIIDIIQMRPDASRLPYLLLAPILLMKGDARGASYVLEEGMNRRTDRAGRTSVASHVQKGDYPIKWVVINNDEHIYGMKIYGRSVTIIDRGIRGYLGDDVVQFEYKDAGLMKLFTPALVLGACMIAQPYVGEFRKELPGELKRQYLDVACTSPKGPPECAKFEKPHRSSGWGVPRIDKDTNMSCSRVGVWSQDVEDFSTSLRKEIEDYDGDNRTDEVDIRTTRGTYVEIKSCKEGPCKEWWDRNIIRCFDVDRSRRGVQHYLKIFDPLFSGMLKW